jgi:hypothetical protein
MGQHDIWDAFERYLLLKSCRSLWFQKEWTSFDFAFTFDLDLLPTVTIASINTITTLRVQGALTYHSYADSLPDCCIYEFTVLFTQCPTKRVASNFHAMRASCDIHATMVWSSTGACVLIIAKHTSRSWLWNESHR